MCIRDRSNEEQLRTKIRNITLAVRIIKTSPNPNQPMRSNEEQMRTKIRILIPGVRINKA